MTDVQKKRPWFKWYPSDWRGEPALRMVSRAARSVWIDMLGLMHESTLVGYLLLNGKRPTPEQLARVLGDDIRDLSGWLDELAAAGVYSETEEGVIYSRRMLRDVERAEKGRADVEMRGGAWGNSGKSAQRYPSKYPNRAPIADPVTYTPNSKHQNTSLVGPGTPGPTEGVGNPYSEEFQEFWLAYPRNSNMTKSAAFEVWGKLGAAGALPDRAKMLVAVTAYRKFLADQSKGRATPYRVQHADKWLKDRKYEGFLEAPATPVGAPMVDTGPGWEAAYPQTWGLVRQQFNERHGSDTVWQNTFAGCRPNGSEFTLICRSRFERETLEQKFGDTLERLFKTRVTFVFGSPPPAVPPPTTELRH